MYEDIKEKFKKLEEELQNPNIIGNQKKLKEISLKHSEIKDVVGMIFELEKIEENIKQNKNIISKENEAELKEMAEEELKELTKKTEELKNNIEIFNSYYCDLKKRNVKELTAREYQHLSMMKKIEFEKKYPQKADSKIAIPVSKVFTIHSVLPKVYTKPNKKLTEKILGLK